MKEEEPLFERTSRKVQNDKRVQQNDRGFVKAEKDGKLIRLGDAQSSKEVRVQEMMDDPRGLHFWLWQENKDEKYVGVGPHGLLEESGHQTVNSLRARS